MSNHGRDFTGEPAYVPGFSAATAAEEPFFVEIDEPAKLAPPPPPPAAADAARPAWMPGPKSKVQNPAPRKPAPPAPPRQAKPQSQVVRNGNVVPFVAVPAEKSERHVPWEERFKQWLRGEDGKGWGVSLLAHAILLLLLFLIVRSFPKQDERLITTIEDNEIADVASVENVQIEGIPEDVVPQIDDPRFDPGLPKGTNPLAPNMNSLGVGLGTSAGSLIGTRGGGTGLKIPSQAITKGSFTVWTVPEDPQPGQQYVIMIQVKLKTAVRRYPRSDLNGNVVGTDGYRDYFGGPTESGFLPVNDDSVQVQACVVPGAQVLVKDVITVESKILKEKQVIEIVF